MSTLEKQITLRCGEDIDPMGMKLCCLMLALTCAAFSTPASAQFKFEELHVQRLRYLTLIVTCNGKYQLHPERAHQYSEFLRGELDNFTRLYGIVGTESVKLELGKYTNIILGGPLTPRGQKVRDYCIEVDNIGWTWLQACKGKDRELCQSVWKK
jgi:hypothetical protein